MEADTKTLSGGLHWSWLQAKDEGCCNQCS